MLRTCLLPPRFKTLFNLDLTLLWGTEERSQFCTCSVTAFCFHVQWWIFRSVLSRKMLSETAFWDIDKSSCVWAGTGTGKSSLLLSYNNFIGFFWKKNQISSKQELVGVCCGKGGREDDNFLHYLGERLKAGGRNENEVRRSVVRREWMTAAERSILEEVGTSS